MKRIDFNDSEDQFYFVRSDIREKFIITSNKLDALQRQVDNLPIKHAKRMLTNVENYGKLTEEQFTAVRKIILDGMNDLKRELQEQEVI